MSSIEEIVSGTDEETERQPLDITREFFTKDNLETKSSISEREIIIIARALWYGERYEIPQIAKLVNKLLLLKRSKGAMSLKAFANTLKNMKPTFETKQDEGGLRV